MKTKEMKGMNSKYRDLVELILDYGYDYEDPNRKGVMRTQINSYTLKHNMLKEGFPFITSKRTYPLLALKELELFMSGETNIRKYWELGVNFWDKDWLRFIGQDEKRLDLPEEAYQLVNIYPSFITNWNGQVDQIKKLIGTLKNNPMSTKKTVTMWDPSVEGVLSPCHFMFQAIVRPLSEDEIVQEYYKKREAVGGDWIRSEDVPKYALTIKWHQHSVDVGLG